MVFMTTSALVFRPDTAAAVEVILATLHDVEVQFDPGPEMPWALLRAETPSVEAMDALMKRVADLGALMRMPALITLRHGNRESTGALGPESIVNTLKGASRDEPVWA